MKAFHKQLDVGLDILGNIADSHCMISTFDTNVRRSA